MFPANKNVYICTGKINYVDEKHLDILQKSIALFMQYGIKSQTMDDIASKMGISKKTLYQYVKNKEDLVQQGISFFVEKRKKEFDEITCCESGNAIDRFIAINRVISQELKQMHPSILFDIQKYYPQAWEVVREFKIDFITQLIKDNIEQGIKEGLYRENLEKNIVAFMYVTMADNLFTTNPLSMQYSIFHLHLELVRYHIRGIASEKGLNYLIENINKNENDPF